MIGGVLSTWTTSATGVADVHCQVPLTYTVVEAGRCLRSRRQVDARANDGVRRCGTHAEDVMVARGWSCAPAERHRWGAPSRRHCRQSYMPRSPAGWSARDAAPVAAGRLGGDCRRPSAFVPCTVRRTCRESLPTSKMGRESSRRFQETWPRCTPNITGTGVGSEVEDTRTVVALPMPKQLGAAFAANEARAP